jgi:hypothetical protein
MPHTKKAIGDGPSTIHNEEPTISPEVIKPTLYSARCTDENKDGKTEPTKTRKKEDDEELMIGDVKDLHGKVWWSA